MASITNSTQLLLNRSRFSSLSRAASPNLAVDADGLEIDITDGVSKPSKSFAEKFPALALVTGFFFFTWYIWIWLLCGLAYGGFLLATTSCCNSNNRKLQKKKKGSDCHNKYCYLWWPIILATLFTILAMYFLNVIFNKKVCKYFPYPYFVSVVHLLVGVVYCLVSWGVGLPKRPPIYKELLAVLTPVAFCHALGHVMSNASFATIAVSFTHTIKGIYSFLMCVSVCSRDVRATKSKECCLCINGVAE